MQLIQEGAGVGLMASLQGEHYTGARAALSGGGGGGEAHTWLSLCGSS